MTEDDEICPHCGSVLDLARAVEKDRSLLARRKRRTQESTDDDPAVG